MSVQSSHDLESSSRIRQQTESTPLMTDGTRGTTNGATSTSRREPSPDSAWVEPDFTPSWIDSFLPHIREKPFTYKLRGNLSAGITVSMINVPLSLALAVASATTPQSGMITAIFGSLFAALFGGSHYNITGPTGALSGILARYAILWGAGCLPILAITSGIVMFLVFVMNWDRFVAFLPSAVAHGFTLGVACIIAGGQLGAAFSLPPIPPSSHFLENMSNYVTEIFQGQSDYRAFGVFFVTWIALFSLVKKFPRFPWMVPIAGFGVLIGWLSKQEYIFPLKTLEDKYGELQLILWNPPTMEPEMLADWGDLMTASLSIAFVGVLESLISGKIADGLTKSTMNQRQETFAVAIANIACGVAGGIPATAALARTALNIRSGGVSRLAGIINSVATVFIGFFLLPAFGYLPLCVVASLLFQVAVGMIEVKHLLHSWHIDRGSFWLTLFVGAACLVFDPTAAIVLGAIGGLLRFAESVATGYSEVTLTRDLRSGTKLDLGYFDAHHHAKEKEGMILALWHRCFPPKQNEVLTSPVRSRNTITEFDQHTLIYRIVGDLTYISAIHHMARLRRMDSSKHLIISFRYCYYVDLDGLDALEECLNDLRANKPDRFILLASITKDSMLYPLLRKCSWFSTEFESRGLVFEHVEDASRFLQGKVGADSNSVSERTSPSSYQREAKEREELAAKAQLQRRLSIEGDLA